MEILYESPATSIALFPWNARPHLIRVFRIGAGIECPLS
jgi:hypothetical protein